MLASVPVNVIETTPDAGSPDKKVRPVDCGSVMDPSEALSDTCSTAPPAPGSSTAIAVPAMEENGKGVPWAAICAPGPTTASGPSVDTMVWPETNPLAALTVALPAELGAV